MVEVVEPRQHGAFDQGAEGGDDQRRDDECRPIGNAEFSQEKIGDEGAQHVERAMGEVDDAQQAEDDGEPQRQKRIEGAVDEADEKLAEKGLDGNSEDHCHGRQTPRTSLSMAMLASSSLTGKVPTIRPWSMR